MTTPAWARGARGEEATEEGAAVSGIIPWGYRSEKDNDVRQIVPGLKRKKTADLLAGL